MKKALFLIIAGSLLLLSCKKDNQPEPNNQEIICHITAPEDGAEILIDNKETISIKGEASVQSGTISKVVLTVNETIIEEISAVPFSYEYDVTASENGQSLQIKLSVIGDEGAEANDEVHAVLKKSDSPVREDGTFTDERDGQIYHTVQIGEQLWMSENLRYLPKQDFDISWDQPRYYIWFDYNLEDPDEMNRNVAKTALETYGAFYNWHAAMNGEKANAEKENRKVRGICPAGWHLPSQEEWQALSDYIFTAGLTAKNADGTDNPDARAKAIAVDGGEYMWILPPDIEDEPQPTWPGVEKEKNNATGFSGVGIGFRACAGEEIWMQSAYSAGWWSSTASSNMEGMYHPAKIWSDNPLFIINADYNPGVGLTIRCLKD